MTSKQVKVIFDSSKRFQCSNSDPVFYLPNTGIKAKSFYINRITIPHSFFNIQAHIQPNYNNIGNNLIDWVDSGGQTNITYLDEGDYSLTQLLTHIGVKMTAAAGDSKTYTASLNEITKKVTITNDTASVFQIRWNSSGIQLNGRSPCQELAKLLGFTSSETCTDFYGDNNNISDLVGLGTYTGVNNVWIGFPRNIYLFSDLCQHSNSYKSSTFFSVKNGVNEYLAEGKNVILATLPVLTTFNDVINYEPEIKEVIHLNTNSKLTQVKFELQNDIFDKLDLRGQPWVIEIVFLQ